MRVPFTSTAFVSNILSVYYSASITERIEGTEWYCAAQRIASGFSEQYGVSLQTAAAVMAVLSPQKAWTKNIDEASRVLDMFSRTLSAAEASKTPKLFCTGAQRAKLLQILSGEKTAEEVITSPKVLAFYCGILTGGQTDSVCVDGHAVNIANEGTRRIGISAAKTPTPKQYLAYAEAYREAGCIVGLTGTQMQAVTWVTYRNL